VRFYTERRAFYCGVDLHARWMYLCILSHEGEVVFHRNLVAGPESFLQAVAPFRDGRVVGAECSSPGTGSPTSASGKGSSSCWATRCT
jgi:hypothetical protein